MTVDQVYVIVVVAAPLVMVVLNRMNADLAALIIAFLLGMGQWAGLSLLGPDRDSAAIALNGLSKPVIWTLISLFILTRALDKYGITRWIAERVLALGGTSERRLILLFCVTAALLSLFMNNVAAGALLLPSAMAASQRSGVRPSKLLIPVAFGTLFGGGATYFTTANIIVSGLLTAANPPQAPLGVLDFALTGVLVAVAGIAFIGFFGSRLLPSYEPLPPLDTPDGVPLALNGQSLRPRGALLSVAITGVAVLAAVLGVPTHFAMLGGALVALVLGLLTPEETYRSVEWRTIFLIAGMYSISSALTYTGLAELFGHVVVGGVARFGGLGLAAGVYLLTMAFTQVMGGQVTALVTGPIAISAALAYDVNPQAIAVVVAMACNAATLTPIAHPVNLLVMVPGRYQFRDFFRIGWRIMLLSFIVLMIGLRLFWGV